ncbi:uncharacterized protein METZ01_LOCUS349580, partial [marine metagenome]
VTESSLWHTLHRTEQEIYAMTQSAVDRASTDRYLSSLDAVVAEYEARNPRSRALHDRAQRTLPGGNTRSGVNIDP